MLKNALLAWTVAVVAVIVAVVFGVRAEHAQQRAATAEAKVTAKERLEKAAVGLESALFVRLDETAHILTYRVPEQIELNGETFVNYRELTASFSDEIGEVYGLPVAGINDVREIPEGTPISIRTAINNDGTVAVEAIYFIH